MSLVQDLKIYNSHHNHQLQLEKVNHLLHLERGSVPLLIKETNQVKDINLMKNPVLKEVGRGMSDYCYKKFEFKNYIFDISEMRDCHRLICHYLNSLLNFKIFHFYLSDWNIKKFFRILCQRIKKFFKRYSNSNVYRKELFRFWKVKRVQIAKVLLDFEDLKLSFRDVEKKIQSIFDNAFIYSQKSKKFSVLHYKFTVFCKIMYNLVFEDYYLYRIKIS